MPDALTLCPKCMMRLPRPDVRCPKCGARGEDVVNLPHQLACGTVLSGKYWIGAVLGQGGFGITYTGYDLERSVKVAVKEYYPSGIVSRNQPDEQVLPVHVAYSGAYAHGRERFLDEARSLARFSRERGVVNVHEFFVANGTAYIVMEFIEGKTLKALANEAGGKLPARRVLALIEPLTGTLARIHEAGLLHRDISPDNILLRADGSAVLIDFGAARQISSNGTRSLTINVKHGYAPEEQYRRRGKQGPWTDVYALCATIYRLTTGKKPPQALDRLIGSNDPLIPPNERGADFTATQQRALLKGLAVRAEDRPQSMQELSALLFGGSGIGPAMSSLLDALVKPAAPGQSNTKQRRGIAIALYLVAIAALVSLVLMLRATVMRQRPAAVVITPELTAAIASATAVPAPEKTPDTVIAAVATAMPESTLPPEPELSPTPTPAPTILYPGYVVSNELALRRRPSDAAEEVFDTLHQDDTVGLINKQNNYYFVWVPSLDEYGYVLCKYIQTAHDGDIPHISAESTPSPTVTPEPTPTPGIISTKPDGDYEFIPTSPPYVYPTSLPVHTAE